MNHLDMLKIGVNHFNQWRKDNPTKQVSLNINELRDLDIDLRCVDFSDIDLSVIDLRGALLCWANMQFSRLVGSHFGMANLEGASLYGANASDCDFFKANLSNADLRKADCRNSNFRYATFYDAELRDADFSGAILPDFQIPDGELVGWGKKSGRLVRLKIPYAAKRTGTLIGRKCRASFAFVEWIDGADEVIVDRSGLKTIYRVGEIVRPDSYDPDIRVECTHGIHFFMTRSEAEDWQ